MEGFVFDLQRFATTDWPNVLVNPSSTGDYYYEANMSDDGYSIISTSNASERPINILYLLTKKIHIQHILI